MKVSYRKYTKLIWVIFKLASQNKNKNKYTIFLLVILIILIIKIWEEIKSNTIFDVFGIDSKHSNHILE